MKKINRILLGIMMTGLFVITSTISFSQEMTKMCNLNAAELKTKFNVLSANAGMKTLQNELAKKGFNKFSTEGTAYGFTGTYKDTSRKSASVEFYAFDYYNKESNQMGSIIWRNDGKSVYKAYLIFPAGEADFEKALEGSKEWYIDASGKVQTASSFGKCWKKCVFKNCKSWCVGAIAVCAAATATIAIASAGPTAGIGVGAAVAIFFGCTVLTCATCFGVCAAGCF